MDVAKLHVGTALRLAQSPRNFRRRRMQLYALAIDRSNRVGQIDSELRKTAGMSARRGANGLVANGVLMCRVHDWMAQVARTWSEMIAFAGARRAGRAAAADGALGSASALVRAAFDFELAISTPEKVTLEQLDELLRTALVGAASCPEETAHGTR